MPTGDAYSSGHLVPSLWDLHMFYLLRPIFFRTCRYFTGLCSSNIPRYFLDFALHFFRGNTKFFITELLVYSTIRKDDTASHSGSYLTYWNGSSSSFSSSFSFSFLLSPPLFFLLLSFLLFLLSFLLFLLLL